MTCICIISIIIAFIIKYHVQFCALCLCFICYSSEGVHRILVATSEGMLYVASIDPKEGGDCRYSSYRLVNIVQDYISRKIVLGYWCILCMKLCLSFL